MATAGSSPDAQSLRKDSVHAQDGYQWQDASLQEMQMKDMRHVAPCLPAAAVHRKRKVKRKDDGLWDTIRTGLLDHQLGMH